MCSSAWQWPQVQVATGKEGLADMLRTLRLLEDTAAIRSETNN